MVSYHYKPSNKSNLFLFYLFDIIFKSDYKSFSLLCLRTMSNHFNRLISFNGNLKYIAFNIEMSVHVYFQRIYTSLLYYCECPIWIVSL